MNQIRISENTEVGKHDYIWRHILVFILFISPLSGVSQTVAMTELQSAAFIDECEAHFRATPLPERYDEWYQAAVNANRLYPSSPAIAGRLAFISTLKKHDPAVGIRILLPFVQEVASNPEIAYNMWRIFNYGYINATRNNERYLIAYWNNLFGENDEHVTMSMLIKMVSYWGRKVDMDLSIPPIPKNELKKQRETLPPVDSKDAIEIWKRIIDNLIQNDIQAAVNQELTNAQAKAEAERGERLERQKTGR